MARKFSITAFLGVRWPQARIGVPVCGCCRARHLSGKHGLEGASRFLRRASMDQVAESRDLAEAAEPIP